MNRKLDGCFFRVLRDGSYQNVCFSDLTTEERLTVLENRNEKWLMALCCHLADCLKMIGEQFDISNRNALEE